MPAVAVRSWYDEARCAGAGWTVAAGALLSCSTHFRRRICRPPSSACASGRSTSLILCPIDTCRTAAYTFLTHKPEDNLSRRGASRAHHTPAPIQREAQTPLTVSQPTTTFVTDRDGSTEERQQSHANTQQAHPRASPPPMSTNARTRRAPAAVNASRRDDRTGDAPAGSAPASSADATNSHASEAPQASRARPAA